ncbi:zincin [Tilletiaria anomala UBC 951]|uniref:Zincin n=1 Tax=Tilletiaria anomala (strain ATCC 24038 / CBS 436.72 / UBC 951) TaxID=1037660 RepID=A0A066V4E2_TILAU|nr:zincin [Tilletiaria anomala UBC 951]KDN35108.1 zincin [Tilletiaria anomala UBC 951]
MQFSAAFLSALLVGGAFAAPSSYASDGSLAPRDPLNAGQLFPSQAAATVEPVFARADVEYLKDVPIHSSCNATQTAQIKAGLDDMVVLAQSTIDHVLRHGRDELFTTYFGEEGDTAPVIGIMTQVISRNKQGMVIRCDDPDAKCNQEGWYGYWRTEVQSETNICDLSFPTRRRLPQICGLGWTVAGSNSALFWGADFLHRLFHVPQISNEKVVHAADSYLEVLELAKKNASAAVLNQHSLQYFALDVYSRQQVPGGCLGTPEPVISATAAPAASTPAVSALTPSPAATAAPAGVIKDCHSHADGTIHCGAD